MRFVGECVVEEQFWVNVTTVDVSTVHVKHDGRVSVSLVQFLLPLADLLFDTGEEAKDFADNLEVFLVLDRKDDECFIEVRHKDRGVVETIFHHNWEDYRCLTGSALIDSADTEELSRLTDNFASRVFSPCADSFYQIYSSLCNTGDVKEYKDKSRVKLTIKACHFAISTYVWQNHLKIKEGQASE